MEYFVLAAAVFCLRLAGSEDLYWRPNTDWNNRNNWKLGRVPCEGDVADFSSVPRGSVIRLDGRATIRSVVLPVGSTIELGKSLTLQFSNTTSCKIETANGPMVAPVEENNLFVGAGPKYWEHSKNWETGDGKSATSPPCGKDRALFREGHYYWTVESNMSNVSVQHLKVRGELVTTELIPKVAPEFKLNLVVDPRCGEDPSLCPCLAVSAGDGVLLFDNPIYETEGVARKKGVKGSPDKADTRAHEMENIAILRPSASHYEPVDFSEDTSSASRPEKKTPILDEYERL
ncbi:hypothetical protein GBAR_LOCUS2437 [Geodia barretti]|uniref:Protein amnionless n=1 Tax=Geodia barretti TaxID=519541 RepID=A0AA35R0G8_GEOBA|nr:hypothetical protein GBAR_LOCUS2437 [Geodia barretti]